MDQIKLKQDKMVDYCEICCVYTGLPSNWLFISQLDGLFIAALMWLDPNSLFRENIANFDQIG